MVAFKIAGKGVWDQKTYVRAVLPEGFPNSPNNGFSKRLDRWTELELRFPAGTKLYVCDGEFWSGKPFSEKLLLVVDAEKANY